MTDTRFDMLQIDPVLWGYCMGDAGESRRRPPTPQWLAMKWRMCQDWVTDDRLKRLGDLNVLMGRGADDAITSFKDLTDMERIALADYLRIYEPDKIGVEDHAGADPG